MITHLVLLELTDEADADEAVDRLNSMVGKIDAIDTFRAGRNVAGSAFHLALVSTHEDEDALATYATHPVHLEVVGWLKPRIANRAVVDFAS